MSTETAVQPQLVPITINGEIKAVPANLSVGELLHWLEVASDRVAVELNRSIVRKRDWQQAVVTAGSHLEIVEFVGGG